MTDRKTASTITDTDLDALYDEIDRLRAKVTEFDHIINWHTTCASCARILDSAYAETVRAEKAEATLTRVTALYEQWVKAGPPPLGASMARWWDKRLTELHQAIHPPTTCSSPIVDRPFCSHRKQEQP